MIISHTHTYYRNKDESKEYFTFACDAGSNDKWNLVNPELQVSDHPNAK